MPGLYDPGKVVDMPTSKQMTEKLREGMFLGLSPVRDTFYTRLVLFIAGKPVNGAALSVSWAFAKYHTLRDLPPEIAKSIETDFNRFIDTVTADADVAQYAKEFRREVRRMMKRERGA